MVYNIEYQGLIDKSQHGFRNGRSCCTQLLEVMETWSQWHMSLAWDVIYTNFARAFDSVRHHRLLNKLYDYELRGKLLMCIKDFLSNRKQRVVTNIEKSRWKSVTSGIPYIFIFCACL